MSKPRITYLGPKASYTHQAAQSYFPHRQYTLAPALSIRDVFTSVQTGAAAHGVVPFENSTNGPVLFSLDLFADRDAANPDVVVTAEIYLDVHHCLLGRLPPSSLAPPAAASLPPSSTSSVPKKSPFSSGAITSAPTPHPHRPPATPLIPLNHVTKVYSHPQAWGQCDTFLATYLRGVERHDVASTSRAAEIVGAAEEGCSAVAIASGLAAEVYGLEVLARGVEDEGGNCTRFFVIGTGGGGEIGLERGGGEEGKEVDGDGEGKKDGDMEGEGQREEWKTLISFTVDHRRPGALAAALEVFRRWEVNLTSINTRPSLVVPWHYIFFVELEGRRRGEGEEGEKMKGAVDAALGELGREVRGWRWLGSWRSGLRRG